MNKTKSQEEQILHYLKLGNRISPHDARRICGSDRLAARIRRLRTRGYKINTVQTHPYGIYELEAE